MDQATAEQWFNEAGIIVSEDTDWSPGASDRVYLTDADMADQAWADAMGRGAQEAKR